MVDRARPWLRQYPPEIDPAPAIEHRSVVDAWRRRVAGNPDRDAIRYFDGTLSARDVDAHSNALAVELQARGIRAGDRVAIYLQNVPHYAIALLAIWQAGAVAVPLNPMPPSRVAASDRDDADVTQADLITFVRDRLAAYKCPRQLHIVKSLPKTATGKIQRAQLRELQRPT
jgi:long-chain acyl-CoA synthetase